MTTTAKRKTVPVSPLFTFKEAARYLRVSSSTLNRFLASGELTGRKVGGTWRFYREDLDACIRKVLP